MRSFYLLLSFLSLAAGSVWAQQPALPAAPVLTAPPTVASEPARSASPSAEIIGQNYSVELRSGNNFVGVLRAATAQDLTFDTKDLGTVTVLRSNLRQLALLTLQQAAKGYEYVGNGTRLFFAPTARNLHRGEGYLQDIDIFLIGANYGITDNISVGVLLPVLPGAGLNVLVITPKVSFEVAPKLNLGAGVLYATAFDESGGIGYGVATYGSADNKLTVGLGYAFSRGETSSTPVVVVGGATRITRRLSLIDETYIVDGGFGGLIGARLAASHISGSLGFVYATNLGGIYPAYVEVAYRFGKLK